MFTESIEEAWQKRYGVDAVPEPAKDLVQFLRHRSVRQFTDHEVSPELKASLIAAAQSASSSSNLQLYSIISMDSRELREKAYTYCGDQSQVRDCAWFLGFFADHFRLRTVAQSIGEQCEGFDYAEFYTVAVVDAALAAERLVCAAEAAGLGCCYIGAFRNNPEGVSQMLNLPEGVFGVFGLAIGYPDPSQPQDIKPRLDADAVYFENGYPKDFDLTNFNQRMVDFYVSQNMKGEFDWTARSARRADAHHMSGRESLLQWLQSRGFLKK